MTVSTLYSTKENSVQTFPIPTQKSIQQYPIGGADFDNFLVRIYEKNGKFSISVFDLNKKYLTCSCKNQNPFDIPEGLLEIKKSGIFTILTDQKKVWLLYGDILIAQTGPFDDPDNDPDSDGSEDDCDTAHACEFIHVSN